MDQCVWCDLKTFFKAYNKYGRKISAPVEWTEYCNYLYKELPGFEVLNIIDNSDLTQGVHPAQFWKKMLEKAEKNAVFALGNSSCVHELLKAGVASDEQRVLENYHSGSMGIDLPFAVGAAEGKPGVPIYCITGDGCFMMNIQELQTIKYNNYQIKIVVFNNSGYDNIRMTCRNYFAGLGNGCDSKSGISMPDFSKIANAFGYEYRKVSNISELDAGIDWIVSQDKLCLMEVIEKQNKERAPLIKSVMDKDGVFRTPPFYVMSPLLSSKQMKKYTKYC